MGSSEIAKKRAHDEKREDTSKACARTVGVLPIVVDVILALPCRRIVLPVKL
jgi:hypothetical protein